MSRDHDVVVVGGGTAGAFAAIAAGRAGARTLLVEKNGYLGGTLAMGMALLGPSDGEGYWALGGIGREALERLRELGGAGEVLDDAQGSLLNQDPELMKLVLLALAREAGVELLLHAIVVGVDAAGGRIAAVDVATKAGVAPIGGQAFVDASGDADVAARAGARIVIGRESDHLSQPASRIFWLGGVDVERMLDHLEGHPEDRTGTWDGAVPYDMAFLRASTGASFDGFAGLVRRAREEGAFTIPRHAVSTYLYGGRPIAGINVTRVHEVDAMDPYDVTRAEVVTQEQVLEALRFFQRYVPGFERCYLASVPHQLGVRESRHVLGEHVLDRDDVLQGRAFDDQIGLCAYPFDIHDVKADTLNGAVNAGGSMTFQALRQAFGIPLRSLLPIGVENLAVAGRCISADHDAASSVRGQAACMVSGQAAGVVAALGARDGRALRDVPLEEVRALLLEQGALLDRTEKIAGAS